MHDIARMERNLLAGPAFVLIIVGLRLIELVHPVVASAAPLPEDVTSAQREGAAGWPSAILAYPRPANLPILLTESARGGK